MFISELDKDRRRVIVTGILDLLVAFICWIFSAIYIACGHGKTSGAMVCLLVPFFVSGMAILILGLTGFYRFLTRAVCCLWNFSMASFTVGMALVGIFEIAGVPKSIFLIPIWAGGVFYAILGIVILLFNVVFWIVKKTNSGTKK